MIFKNPSPLEEINREDWLLEVMIPMERGFIARGVDPHGILTPVSVLGDNHMKCIAICKFVCEVGYIEQSQTNERPESTARTCSALFGRCNSMGSLPTTHTQPTGIELAELWLVIFFLIQSGLKSGRWTNCLRFSIWEHFYKIPEL